MAVRRADLSIAITFDEGTSDEVKVEIGADELFITPDSESKTARLTLEQLAFVQAIREAEIANAEAL